MKDQFENKFREPEILKNIQIDNAKKQSCRNKKYNN